MLTGSSLAEASQWLRTRPEDLSDKEQAFIEASKKVDEEVRRAAAVGGTTPELARRLHSEYQAEYQADKQRLDERSAQLDSRATSVKWVGMTTVLLLILLIVAGAITWWWKVRHQNHPTSSLDQASTQGQGTSGSSGISDADVAKAQLASSLVSLGIVSSLSDGVAMSPQQGVLAIDELIMKSKQQDPKVQAIAESDRVAFLRNSEPLFGSEPQFREYVCQHNSYVIAARVDPDRAALEVSRWKKQYPLAQVVPQKSDDPSTVPIVVSFFLTCDRARQEVANLHRNKARYGQAPSQGWFTSCPACPITPPPTSGSVKPRPSTGTQAPAQVQQYPSSAVTKAKPATKQATAAR